MRFGSIPFIVLDLLASDGGWLTTAGVVLMFPDEKDKTVNKVLTRMKGRGWLESRRRFPDIVWSEHEWRITLGGELKLRTVPA